MDDNNKNNLHFFAADSMSELHEELLEWQAENQKRFLSLEIQHDEGQFCCLALTNPSEVVIMTRDKNYSQKANWQEVPMKFFGLS